MLLNRECITNAAVMIQPSLISYSFNAPPSPALLDVASIAADRILLLDSYFSVVIFHGMTIAQWRNMGYQNQPEHQVCPFQDYVIVSGSKARTSADYTFFDSLCLCVCVCWGQGDLLRYLKSISYSLV